MRPSRVTVGLGDANVRNRTTTPIAHALNQERPPAPAPQAEPPALLSRQWCRWSSRLWLSSLKSEFDSTPLGIIAARRLGFSSRHLAMSSRHLSSCFLARKSQQRQQGEAL